MWKNVESVFSGNHIKYVRIKFRIVLLILETFIAEKKQFWKIW